MARAHCIWENSEICIDGDGTPAFLLEEPDKTRAIHGISKEYHISLRVEEAKNLIESLKEAIRLYNEMESFLEQYEEDGGK